MPLSPEEFLAEAKQEHCTRVPRGTSRRMVAKVLRMLAPVYGYTTHDVAIAWDERDDSDLVTAFRNIPGAGDCLPSGLIIGGHSGLSYGDILHPKFREKKWWLKFRNHMNLHDEVIWILPIKGAGYWVIHNTVVNPNRQQPAVIIPARRKGLNHVRVIRLESFVEEHSDE